MPASPTATPAHIKDVNTRYHDAAADEYDAKWGIDFGATGQEQVRLKLAKALGGADRRARLRRRPRDRLRDRLLLAQPAAARHRRAADRDRHLPRDAASGSRRQRGAARPRGARPSRPRPRNCPSRTRASTSSSATRSSTTSPTSSGPSPSSAASCVPAARSPSRASPPATATVSRRCRSAPDCSSPPPGAARSAPSPGASAEDAEAHDHALEHEVDVHAFAPADLRRILAATGFDSPRVGGEELLANAWGWVLRTRRGERRARIGLLALAQVRLPQLPRAAEGRHRPARAAPAGRALLQPAAQRPQAGLAVVALRGGRGRASRLESMPFSRRSPAKE